MNWIIIKTITLRYRISYGGSRFIRLDNNIIAVSTLSTCIKNAISLIGMMGTGSNPKYDYKADSDYNTSDIKNVAANTNVIMKVGNESYI